MRRIRNVIMIVFFAFSITSGCSSSDECTKENAENKLKVYFSEKGWGIEKIHCSAENNDDCKYKFWVIITRGENNERCSFDYTVEKTMSGKWAIK